MDSSSGNTLGDTSSSVEVQPFSVGAVLRDAREQLGLSVADVESRLKFASRQIEELEADNYIRLPETAFVRRFVRSYAKLLQLDPDPLLAALPVAPVRPSLHTASSAIEVPFPNAYSARRLKIIWLVTGFVVVMITLVLFAWLNRSLPAKPPSTVQKNELPVTSTSASVVLAVPNALIVPSEVPAVPVQGVAVGVPPILGNSPSAAKVTQTEPNGASRQSASIRMTFEAESWVKVTDNDGKILLSKLNSSGSEQYLKGRPPFAVVIGNINGVRLYYQGKLIELAPFNNGGSARLTLE